MRTPFSSSRRRLLQAATLASTATAFSATHAQTRSTAAPTELRIGFQKAAVNLVLLKQRGTLEQRFPQTKVAWVEFPAGPQLLEALSVGSLEFGLTGDSPPVFAQAAGKDLVYVGAEPPKPESSAILVRADAPLKQLSDLRGKRIALQKGSSAHYVLVRAVEKAGLRWQDIEPIYLAPAEARAAFERGSVDAWSIWDPFYAATELALKARPLVTGRELSSNNSFYLASRPFAQQHGAAIAQVFTALNSAAEFARDQPKQTAQFMAQTLGLDLAVSERFLARRPYSPVAPLTPDIVTDQQRVADAFLALGLIPKQIRVAEIVWPANRLVA